jgi:hypothetical protein
MERRLWVLIPFRALFCPHSPLVTLAFQGFVQANAGQEIVKTLELLKLISDLEASSPPS